VPLDPKAGIRVGDQLTTGPAGSTSYVAGLAVGTVSAVRTAADGTARADLTPATAPSRLDLVGVILVGGEPVQARTALEPSNVAQR
ncbi:MAG: hypothetical protein QOH14_443, partial [Pseudonocardiales bacterium]|jgi:cell shape-determining protein MreC|nr:hypothetical protein [Pseudonocardiales bacterium]